MLKLEGFESIKGIIFDCYNTLIDILTDEDSIETYRPVSNWLIYQGVKIDANELMSEYKSMVKEELDSSWEKYPEIKVELVFNKICKQHALWDIDESALGAKTACAFRAASLRRFRTFHQSIRLLKELEGTPMGIVSNAQKVFSELELRYLDLSKHFEFFVFSSEFGHKKPDPRIFLEGASRLGLKPEEILSIGDNMEHDIIPSAKLGMKAMHIEEAWNFSRWSEGGKCHNGFQAFSSMG
jgi:putative hydrolase of the HAD superfamily